MRLNRTHSLALTWLVGIGIAVVLVHVVRFTIVSTLLRNLVGSLHGPGFGLISLSFLVVFRSWNRPARAYVLAIVTTTMLGTLTEVLQFVGPRDADVIDLLHNIAGTLGFLGVAALFDKTLKREISYGVSSAIKLATPPLFLVAIVPTLWFAYATHAQFKAFPEILTFENAWERSTYRAPWRMKFELAPEPSEWPGSNGRAALLVFDPNITPGFEIAPYPDWSKYTKLSFVASSVSARTVRLTIVIRDKDFEWKGRKQFEAPYDIGPGFQKITIPITDIQRAQGRGNLDLSAITALVVALIDPHEGDAVLVDDVRLE